MSQRDKLQRAIARVLFDHDIQRTSFGLAALLKDEIPPPSYMARAAVVVELLDREYFAVGQEIPCPEDALER